MTDTSSNGNGILRTVRKVPIAVWTFLFTQLIAIVIFAVRLDNRVTHLEQVEAVQNAKLDAMEKSFHFGSQAIIRNEERLNGVIERLSRPPQQR